QPVGVLADLRQHRLVVPWRVADEMLELLGAALVNPGCQRRKRAIPRLCQSAQIASSHRRTVACLGAEEAAIAIDEDWALVHFADGGGDDPSPGLLCNDPLAA